MPHHLRRTDREIPEPERIEQLLHEGRFCSVALVDADGPYIVTLSYGYDPANRRLYFHCAGEGRKISAIKADPRACATVVFDRGYKDGECAHPYQSLVLAGRMRVVADETEKIHGLRVLVEHQERGLEDAFEAMGFGDPQRSKGVNALAFDIETVTGKEGE